MQLEEMDDKIKEAAENHHPAYNENAWPQMEKLLDKHLPQKKDDRRRFFLLLLLFLLAGGSVWLLVNKPWKNEPVAKLSTENNKTAGRENTSAENTIRSNNKNSKPDASGTTEPAGHSTSNGTTPVSSEKLTDKNGRDVTNTNPNTTDHNLPANSTRPINTSGKPSFDNKNNKASTTPAASSDSNIKSLLVMETGAGQKRKRAAAKTSEQKNNIVPPTDNTVNNDIAGLPDMKQPVVSGNAPVSMPVAKNDPPVDTASDEKPKEVTAGEGVKKETAAVSQKPAENPVKAKKARKGNSLAISFSAGPDLSMIGFKKAGELKTIAGAGLSYTFAGRLTVSAGVYTSRKVYTAAPSDYKFSYTPPGYNYMTQIDGDCKVLEIPLNLSWSFGKSKKGNWFAGTGISSLLMKKEKYDYVYKYPGGTPYTYTSNHSNENKHIFSILNISGGYRRNINRYLFAAVEPYLQVPINNGVGAGKIKLNSSGVLFSIGIRPFAR